MRKDRSHKKEPRSMTDNPLVSILTPSYNQAEWLIDNLRSVSSQTYQNLEHIVFDGGSTDGSVEILRTFPDPRLQWTSEPDRGQSHALNKALAASKGEIVGWVNSDDGYVDRRAVSAVVECFAANPEVGVVYGHSLLVNASNSVLQVLWALPRIDPFRRIGTPFYQPSVFMRRSLLGDALVDESLHYVMDADLWRRLYGKTQFARVNLFIGLERVQPNRKVMSDGYLDERRAYNVQHGIGRHPTIIKIARRSMTVSSRIRAWPDFLRIDDLLQPAIDLRLPDRRTRTRQQLLTPRSRMRLVDSPSG